MTRSCLCSAFTAALLILTVSALPAAAAVRVADRWSADSTITLTAAASTLTVKRGAPMTLTVRDGSGRAAECIIALLSPAAGPAAVASAKVVRADDGAATLQLVASSPAGRAKATATLDAGGELTVNPADGCRGARIAADYAYCVLPSRHVDDCIFAASAYPNLSRLYLPSEGLLMGLLRGGNAILCLAWMPAGQLPSLVLSGRAKARRIEAIDLQAYARQPLYIGLLTAPGIWHAVKLDDSFEERDVQLNWKPPFKANWKTQLKERGVPTTFFMVEGKHRRWRPVVSWFVRPLFTKAGKVFLHPSKRMECTGMAFIYALDRADKTPYAFFARHIPPDQGRKLIETGEVRYVLRLDPTDVPPRVMDTHCFGRDVLRYTTLAVGNVEREKDFLRTHIYDRRYETLGLANYSFQRAVDWMKQMLGQLDQWSRRESKNKAVRDYLAGLHKMLADTQREYYDRLGGQSAAHVIRLIEKNTADFVATLNQDGGIEICPKLLHHIRQLNSVISMNESLSARFGTNVRNIFQQAAYRAVFSPSAARYAEAIRDAIRRQLLYRSWESAVKVEYSIY